MKKVRQSYGFGDNQNNKLKLIIFVKLAHRLSPPLTMLVRSIESRFKDRRLFPCFYRAMEARVEDPGEETYGNQSL